MVATVSLMHLNDTGAAQTGVPGKSLPGRGSKRIGKEDEQ